MTTQTIIRILVATTSVALLLVGCGSKESDGGVSTVPATPTSTGVPPMSDQQAPPSRLVFDVTIKGGEVTPTNAQLKTTVGSPVIIRVTSDVADQLHIHSNPEHTFTVEPRGGQSFQFTVTVPGKVDVELHELKRTIATIQVQ